MNKRTLGVLSVFVALLVAAYVMYRDPAQKGIRSFDLTRIDANALTRVVLKGESTIELVKNKDGWRVGTKLPADPAAIDVLKRVLAQAKVMGAITERDNRYAEFGVEDKKGTQVILFAGNKSVADFVIGNAYEQGAYVRLDGAVFKVPMLRSSHFALDRAHWLDRSVFANAAKDGKELKITLADASTLTMTRKENAWVLADDVKLPERFRLDSAAVDRYAAELLALNARDVPDEAPAFAEAALATPTFTVIAKLPTQEIKVVVGIADAGAVARVEGGLTYVVDAAIVEKLKKHVIDFRDLSVMKIDPAKITSIRFEEGKRILTLKKTGEAWAIEKSTETTPEGFALALPQVENRLRGFSGLHAEGLEETEPTAAGLNRPAMIASLTDDAGVSMQLACGGEFKGDGNPYRYCRGNADDRVYRVASSRLQGLFAGIASFKADPAQKPFELNEEMLQQLPPDVRAQFLRQMRTEKGKQALSKQLNGQ